MGKACDVVISHPSGRVAIRDEVVDDTSAAFTVSVARVNTAQLRSERITPDVRRLTYATSGRDDTIDIYVVGDQVNQAGTSVRRAMSITREIGSLTGDFERHSPLVASVVMSTSPLTGPAMDLSDNECFPWRTNWCTYWRTWDTSSKATSTNRSNSCGPEPTA